MNPNPKGAASARSANEQKQQPSKAKEKVDRMSVANACNHKRTRCGGCDRCNKCKCSCKRNAAPNERSRRSGDHCHGCKRCPKCAPSTAARELSSSPRGKSSGSDTNHWTPTNESHAGLHWQVPDTRLFRRCAAAAGKRLFATPIQSASTTAQSDDSNVIDR